MNKNSFVAREEALEAESSVLDVLADKPPENSPDEKPPETTRSRLFKKLSDFWDDSSGDVLPEVSPVLPGVYIFYPAATNEIHAEPSAGKTNIVMSAMLAEIRAGGHCVYIDPEDAPKKFLKRLRRFGATRCECDKIEYCHQPSPTELEEIVEEIKKETENPPMVCFDGLAVLMAQEGLDEKDNSHCTIFYQARLQPLSKMGACVVVSDHVTKSEGGRSFGARGGGAKKGNYDGVSYSVEIKTPYSKTKAGEVIMIISKDRHGSIGAKGDKVFSVKISPVQDDPDHQTMEWKDIRSNSEDKPVWRPTECMEAVVAFLRKYPKTPTSQVNVGMKNTTTRLALDLLLEEDVVVWEREILKSGAEGQAMLWSLKNPKIGKWDPSAYVKKSAPK
jgi:hypothetical protein